MSKHIKTWQERGNWPEYFTPGYEGMPAWEAAKSEIAELRAALATPPVASGALPELPPVPLSCHVVRNGLGGIAFYAYAPEEMQAYARAYGQACAAVATPNAALVAALQKMVNAFEGRAQHGYSEYLDEQDIIAARAALAQAGQVVK